MIQESILLETLTTVRQRIQQIRERKEIMGEENTKATLIEPIFTALGWKLQEIDEVRREYKRKPQDNPVDYALFLNRTECLFVEAKSLEKDLGDRKWVSQNLSYATVVGVCWCVLTNGDEYRIYNSHAPVDVDEKLFRAVRISDSEPGYLMDTLVLLSRAMMQGALLDELWKAHFIDRNVRAGLEKLLSPPDAALERLIQKKASVLTLSDIRSSLKRAKIRIDFPVPCAPATLTRSPVPSRAMALVATPRASGKKTGGTATHTADITLDKLIAAEVIHAPLALERDYKGTHLAAVVESNGKVQFDGAPYESLSTAAGMARKQVAGAPPNRPYPQTNGWTFWQYRDEHNALHVMDELRQRYLAIAQAATA